MRCCPSLVTDRGTVNRRARLQHAAVVPVLRPIEGDRRSGGNAAEDRSLFTQSLLQQISLSLLIRARASAADVSHDRWFKPCEADVVKRVVDGPQDEPSVSFLSIGGTRLTGRSSGHRKHGALASTHAGVQSAAARVELSVEDAATPRRISTEPSGRVFDAYPDGSRSLGRDTFHGVGRGA